MIGAIASVAGSVIPSIVGLFAGRQQTKRNMADLNATGQYQANPYAAQQLAMMQNLYNGRMAGATGMEQNIYGNQANVAAGVQRNATDASQALAMLSGLQGQSNDAFAELAQREAMDRMQRAGMVAGAQNTMINEGDKVFQDKLRFLQNKMGIRAVGYDNMMNSVNSLGKSLSMAGNMWDAGAFKKGGSSGLGSMFGSFGAKQ